ncbi:MAG TPA: M23 family metallopeptidase [Micromonosporaceae bacterium]
MRRPQWRIPGSLVAAAMVAVLVTAAAPIADADLIPLPLPSIGLPGVGGILPQPSPSQSPLLPLPLPSIDLPPLLNPPATSPSRSPAASASTPARTTGPGSGPGGGSAAPVAAGDAAAIIGADPGADLYPQPPVDPATTPQARQVAALEDVEHRIQYLNNVLARTRADLATLHSQPDPVPELLVTLTGAASAATPVPPSPAGAGGGAGGTESPVFALSAAIASGQSELSRRQDEANALLQDITRRTLAAPVTSSSGYTGGPLTRPVPGPMTSGFGVRLDPYYHVWQMHAGIDLAAPTGTPIVAAAGGRVTQAGWFGGYGNYTCIDHGVVDGQRLSTCYGHQSAILVSVGQQVRAGQVIGRVGATGAATGPHLHFEVRLNGRPVNPLAWL